MPSAGARLVERDRVEYSESSATSGTMSAKPISSIGERERRVGSGLLSREDPELSEDTVRRRRPGVLSDIDKMENGLKVGRGYNIGSACQHDMWTHSNGGRINGGNKDQPQLSQKFRNSFPKSSVHD